MESGPWLTKNPEAETKAETTKENCLLAYSQAHIQLHLYIVQAHLSKGSTAYTYISLTAFLHQSTI